MVIVNITVCYEIDVKFWSFMLLKMWWKKVFWKRVNCDCDVDDYVIVRVAPHVFLCHHDFKVRVLNSGRATIFYIAENCEMWLKVELRILQDNKLSVHVWIDGEMTKSWWIALILAKATLLSFPKSHCHYDFAELTVNPNICIMLQPRLRLNLYFKPCLVRPPRLEGFISSVYWQFYVNIKDHERDWTATLTAI